VHFEAALNVLWFSLGLLALANAIRTAWHRTAAGRRAPGWLHIIGVALIVAALFPYISATDDILRIEHINTQQSPRHPAKQSQKDGLMLLYQTMDSPLVCQAPEVALNFFFISLVVMPVVALTDRSAPSEAGRSPPLPQLA
jgi:hypothetical protein